ncbi:hypothetical protein [Streptomyces sp. NPDC102462]
MPGPAWPAPPVRSLLPEGDIEAAYALQRLYVERAVEAAASWAARSA